MKKLLLATTSIAGASFMATAAMAAPEVRLGGFMNFQVGIVSQDVDRFGASPGGVADINNTRGYGFMTDNEVILRVSDKLDSGLAWSLKIELEANTDSGSEDAGSADDVNANAADEVTLTLSGSFGQIWFGSDDGPVDTMKTGGKRAVRDAGTGGIGGDFRRWVAWDSASGRFWSNAADVRDTSDATKITYITPRFAGFQAGVSFAPSRDADGRFRDSDDPANPVGPSEENFWELALNYDQKFGGFRVNAAGILSLADNENDQLEDVRAWHVGAMVGYAGFSLGGGYGTNGDRARARGATNTDVNGWDVGLGYNMGAWDFGVSYYRSEVGVENGSGENELQVAAVGATYDMGSGLTVYVEGVWYSSESGTAAATDSDGYALITGIGVEF